MKKSVGLAILMVFLLLYPRFAAEGARYGLLLWYTSVVPSLFPFMVLSSLIVSSGGVSLLMKPVRAFLGPWASPFRKRLLHPHFRSPLRLPHGGKDLRGFCPGGKLSVQEGRFLMAICNHPSPMFLLGFVCPLFEAGMHPSRLLLSIYLPLLPLAALAKRIYFPVLPAPASSGSRPQTQPAPALDMAILGGSRDPLPHRRLPDAVFHRDRIFTPRTVAPRLSPALPYGHHGNDHRSPGGVRLPSLPGLRNRRRCHPGFRRHMRHLPDPGRDCSGWPEEKRAVQTMAAAAQRIERTVQKIKKLPGIIHPAIYSLEASSQRPGRRHLPAPGRTGLILPEV